MPTVLIVLTGVLVCMRVLRSVKHSNLMRYYGVCANDGMVYIDTELLRAGGKRRALAYQVLSRIVLGHRSHRVHLHP